MAQTILLIDVGGTNTRAKVFSTSQETLFNSEMIAETSLRVSTKSALLDFIANLLSDRQLKENLSLAVVCFAGQVNEQNEVTVTNWLRKRHITLSELVQCGLPANNTLLLNDMEAAAWGLLDMHHNDARAKSGLIPFYEAVDGTSVDMGNMILLMPGTGMGVASIIAGNDSGQAGGPVIIPAEVQHSTIPALDPEHANLIKVLSNRLGKSHISWEDFTSGKALENIYATLKNINPVTLAGSTEPENALSVEVIAERAIIRGDPLCRCSLSIYYRCIGSLAQVLALTLRPFCGIYLMGRTIKQNLSFIPQSGFLQELQNNKTQGNLLKQFPVYLIPDDLNLDGLDCIARRHLKITDECPTSHRLAL